MNKVSDQWYPEKQATYWGTLSSIAICEVETLELLRGPVDMVLRDDQNALDPMLEDLVWVVGRARPDLEASTTVGISILDVQAFVGREWLDEVPVKVEDLFRSPDIGAACLYRKARVYNVHGGLNGNETMWLT
jgi:hypothetical protein